jgi:hypothetical protein
MHTYRVITEIEDGSIHREGPRSVQNLKQLNTYYAAETIEAVWEAIELDRLDEAVDVIAIIKEHPVQILK